MLFHSNTTIQESNPDIGIGVTLVIDGDVVLRFLTRKIGKFLGNILAQPSLKANCEMIALLGE